jgi:hypothetical protein
MAVYSSIILGLNQNHLPDSTTSSGSEKGEEDGGGEQRQEAKMLVTFRVKDIDTRLHSKPAQLRPPSLERPCEDPPIAGSARGIFCLLLSRHFVSIQALLGGPP